MEDPSAAPLGSHGAEEAGELLRPPPTRGSLAAGSLVPPSLAPPENAVFLGKGETLQGGDQPEAAVAMATGPEF